MKESIILEKFLLAGFELCYWWNCSSRKQRVEEFVTSKEALLGSWFRSYTAQFNSAYRCNTRWGIFEEPNRFSTRYDVSCQFIYVWCGSLLSWSWFPTEMISCRRYFSLFSQFTQHYAAEGCGRLHLYVYLNQKFSSDDTSNQPVLFLFVNNWYLCEFKT